MTYDHIAAVMSKSRLPEIRKERQLTVAELAALLSVSPQTIESFEKGRYDPPLSLALRIAGHQR